MRSELRLARTAPRQEGIITLSQLLDAGLSDYGIRQRVATGWLTRRHAGVYRMGVFGGPPGDEVAGLPAEVGALRGCGSPAVISHQSAAALWGLMDRPRPVHVSAPRDRRHAGITVH